jgi:2-methylcitrate dehydratase PrpD
MTFVQELAERAHSVASGPLPADVEQAARRHVADTVGTIAAGWASVHGEIDTVAAALGLGGGARTGAVLGARRAAFVGGVYAHYWEFDDLHRGAVVCPGCVVLPALLGAARLRPEVSFAQFLRTFVAGYEVALGAALAAEPEELIGAGWWPTALFGPLGGAAAASLLLGHGVEETTLAIGVAAAHAGGTVAGTSGERSGRYLLGGVGAERGLLAALTARTGWGGPEDVLDAARSPLRGARGVYAGPIPEPTAGAALAAARRHSHVRADHSPGFHVLDTSIKLHAGANHVQAAIDALQSLRGDVARLTGDAVSTAPDAVLADHIIAVRCYLPRPLAAVVDRPLPLPSAAAALSSAQYILATVLIRGRSMPEDFGPASTIPADLREALARRVEVHADEELTAAYPARWGARVEVVTPTHVLHARRDEARGDPGRDFPVEALRAKFIALAGPVFGPDRAAALVHGLLVGSDAPFAAALAQLL